jgi:RimJ/RimL family protein N-acetyltransferase
MTPATSHASKKTISIDCGKTVARTATPADASERWGRWSADAQASAMLNLPAKALSKSEVAAYIASFDQVTHLLLTICDKASGEPLGFLRVDIDERLNRFLVRLLIGEADRRNTGILSAGTVPFYDYCFETLGLKTMLATVLSHNKTMTRYLLKNGWNLDKKRKRHVKSRTDERMLDLCFFSISREAWRAFKERNPRARREA